MFIVHLAGHLGKDPETRFTPSGQKVTTFNVATNQRKGKEDVTVWVRVTVWGDKFDKLISYLKKGSAVIVVGKLQPPTSYTDKEGRTQITLEVTAEMIEFSPFGKTDRPSEGNQQQNQHDDGHQTAHTPYSKSSYSPQTIGQGNAFSNQVDDDTLPF